MFSLPRISVIFPWDTIGHTLDSHPAIIDNNIGYIHVDHTEFFGFVVKYKATKEY